MKALLLIDHGSRLAEANEMLECMANLVQAVAGPDVIVRAAHMELADPDIPTGFASCVEAGATEVVAFPYMLSPGRHATSDIPFLVSEAAQRFPDIAWSVTTAFGVHEKLAEVILLRAGLEPVATPAAAEVCRCWHPTEPGACGDACRARQPALTAQIAGRAQVEG